MLWGQVKLSAFTLNACKNVIGSTIVVIHIAIVGFIYGSVSLTTNPIDLGWLALSSLIGIVAGDTLYFRCLQILGARKALLIACTSPLFALVFGFLFLQQHIGLVVLAGILMTLFGIATVVADRRADVEAPGLLPGRFRTGVIFGLLSAGCQALGGLCSTIGMRDCGALEAMMVRLLVAGFVTVFVLLSQKATRKSLSQTFQWNYLKFVIPATAIGTWLGIWCCQIAYKSADLAIAQTLMATCPLFAIPVVWIVFGHKPTRLAIVGTIVALAGIAMTLQDDPEPDRPADEETISMLVQFESDGNRMNLGGTWSVSQTPLADRKNTYPS